MGLHGDSFGAELRRRRTAADWSLNDLAVAVHYSKGYLSRVETGRKTATRELARACDAALDAGGELAELADDPKRSAPGDVATASGASQGNWLLRLGADGEGLFTPLGPSGDPAPTALLGWAPRVLTTGSGLSSAGERFAALFDELRSLGRAVHAAAVVPSVITQTSSLAGLATRASSPARERLLRLAGRHAEYAAWMAQELGDDKAAFWWLDRAVQLATEAGDGDLVIYTLVRRAGLALYRDDPLATVELAVCAAEMPDAPAWLRRQAHQRAAQGYALMGDPDRCRRMLAAATDIELDSGGQTLGSTSVPDQHALVTGWCLLDLGSAEPSAQLLDLSVIEVPEQSTRARLRFDARRALAHAGAGDPEGACRIADGLLESAVAIGSATVAADLRRLRHSLRRWATRPDVVDLQLKLAAATR